MPVAAVKSVLPRPVQVRAIRLTELASLRGGQLRGLDRLVTGITADSGAVRPGDLFAGLPGRTTHGAQFTADAVAAGAVAVLTDAAGVAFAPSGVPVIVVDDVRSQLGPVAAAVYGWPSRATNVLGVTGTSGKTTTTYLLRDGLMAAGAACGLIGTVGAFLANEALAAGLTTPEAPELQALLAVMVERGAHAVAIEVSSHALAMHRVDGIDFAVGAFTNLSQDHLDFHADMGHYFATKARLFDGRSRSSVVVIDDHWGRRLVRPGIVTVSTDGSPADWRAVDVAVTPSGGNQFRLIGSDVDIVVTCAVPGRYNVANAALALAMLNTIGVPPKIAAPAIASTTVPGRMERVDAGQPFLAVVDYSHKPAAVEAALLALRPLTPRRLTVVLGCGGDRDVTKRPVMGAVAARCADRLIVTDDNPRSEDPAAIRAAIVSGALTVEEFRRGEVLEIGDRGTAIMTAIADARAGDTILVAGKGHETGQEVGNVVYPFDDRVALRTAIGEGSRL